MMRQDKSAVPNTSLTSAPEQSAPLSEASMPSTSRTNVFSRVASVTALSAALATNALPAQAQTNVVPEPTPKVAPLVPGIPVIDAAVAQQFISAQVPATATPPAAPAANPAPARDTARSNITVLEKRPFCMTDEGKILLVNDRESQVRRPGSTVSGAPSTGTALQALAYAKEHLLEMNGGTIPEGCKAKLYIRSAGVANVCELNLQAIPAVADLGRASHHMALNDPMTGQAIKTIHNGLTVLVKNDGGAFTMTFMNKLAPGQPLLMTVELEK